MQHIANKGVADKGASSLYTKKVNSYKLPTRSPLLSWLDEHKFFSSGAVHNLKRKTQAIEASPLFGCIHICGMRC